MKNFFIVLSLLIISACNGGRLFISLDDVAINKQGLLTGINGGEPKEKEIVYRGDFSGLVFYRDGMTYKDEQKFGKNINESNSNNKQCVYMLSYFVPINFWNFNSMKSSKMAKQVIEDFNKKNNTDYKVMKNGSIVDYWLGTPIFSYQCKVVLGLVSK